MEKITMAESLSVRQKRYHGNIKQGLCPRCGSKKKKNSKFSFCDDCRSYFREYNQGNAKDINKTRKIRYDERKKNHQCPRCGVKLAKSYKKILCKSCQIKQYGYNS
jgi:ribosomal protein S27AE